MPLPGAIPDPTAALDKLSRGLGSVFDAINSGLSKVKSTLGAFVELSNPTVFTRFNFAMRDMQGVIGQILAPSLIRATATIRAMGDVLASLSPATKAIIGNLALGSGLAGTLLVVAQAAKLLVGVLSPWTAIMGIMVGVIAKDADAMKTLETAAGAASRVLEVVSGAFEKISKVLTPLIGQLGELELALIGLAVAAVFALRSLGPWLGTLAAIAAAATAAGVYANRDRPDQQAKPGQSVGAAVRPAAVTDYRSLINQAYASAFGASIERQQLDSLKLAEKQRADMIEQLKQLNKSVQGNRSSKEGGYFNPVTPTAGAAKPAPGVNANAGQQPIGPKGQIVGEERAGERKPAPPLTNKPALSEPKGDNNAVPVGAPLEEEPKAPVQKPKFRGEGKLEDIVPELVGPPEPERVPKFGADVIGQAPAANNVPPANEQPNREPVNGAVEPAEREPVPNNAAEAAEFAPLPPLKKGMDLADPNHPHNSGKQRVMNVGDPK